MALSLEKLVISRADNVLLNVNACVEKGQVLTVMGPSGAGKSTLLQAIAGQLYEPFSVSGIIKIDNNVINRKPAHLRKVGMMFQDALLFEHMTVAENIAFAMPKTSHSNPHARMEAINTMLSAVELESMGQRGVNTLSGGQQSRVSLLRTLASAPDVVLLDEPFSKLDLAQLKARNIPAVLVTHDKEDAIAAGGQIIELSPC